MECRLAGSHQPVGHHAGLWIRRFCRHFLRTLSGAEGRAARSDCGIALRIAESTGIAFSASKYPPAKPGALGIAPLKAALIDHAHYTHSMTRSCTNGTDTLRLHLVTCLA